VTAVSFGTTNPVYDGSLSACTRATISSRSFESKWIAVLGLARHVVFEPLRVDDSQISVVFGRSVIRRRSSFDGTARTSPVGHADCRSHGIVDAKEQDLLVLGRVLPGLRVGHACEFHQDHVVPPHSQTGGLPLALASNPRGRSLNIRRNRIGRRLRVHFCCVDDGFVAALTGAVHGTHN